SADEWLAVRDPKSGVEGRASLRVVGPVEKMIAFEARTPRDRAPETYRLAPGDRLHLQVAAMDSAGNRVFLHRLAWRAQRDGRDASKLLAHAVTFGSPDYGFEPTGNVFTVPADDPSVVGAYAIVAEDEKSKKNVGAQVEVVAPGAGAATQATHNPGKI